MCRNASLAPEEISFDEVGIKGSASEKKIADSVILSGSPIQQRCTPNLILTSTNPTSFPEEQRVRF
jgi:hypothetical protein